MEHASFKPPQKYPLKMNEKMFAMMVDEGGSLINSTASEAMNLSSGAGAPVSRQKCRT